MTRSTSIEVYHQIKSEGLLSTLRMETYEIVFMHGPLTMAEAAQIMRKNPNSISPRFAELRKIGVIQEQGRKICSVSGRHTIKWEVTKNLPIKLDKTPKAKCPWCNGSGHHQP